jgi:hypothetical protein
MPRRTRAVDQNQLGFDETPVNDPTLESALEERQAAKVGLGAARKVYKEAHEAAKVEVEKLELPDGKAVRCGRFRITRSTVEARHVEFDTDPTSRVKITLLDADEGEDLDDVGDEPTRPDPTDIATLRNRAADARADAPSVTM